jgi:serine/threonine-protein kinase
MLASGDVLRTRSGEAIFVRELLGRGGMGEVWRADAEGREPRSTYAVKVLRADRAVDQRELHRFEREARTLERLEHEGIVQALDHGRCEDGRPFIVMEYVHGRHLGRLIAEEAPLAFRRVAEIVRLIAGAVQSAHEVGVVHLDLKPSNVLVLGRGDSEAVKVVDFGISQVVGEDPEGRKLTPVVGSLGYLAPERISHPEIADPRSDQFSLAVLAYELITGIPAFPSTGDPAVDLATVLESQPPPPSSFRPAVPTSVERVLAIALDKTPVDRYATILEFSEALTASLTGLQRRSWLSPGRRRAAAFTTLGFLALGVLDVVLRVTCIGPTVGLRSVATDSAKSVFHLVQLPLVAGLLALRLPRALLVMMWRWYRTVAITVALLFVGVVTAVTSADVREAICERLTLPEDVADPALRAELLTFRDVSAAHNPAARRAAYEQRLQSARGPRCGVLRFASGRALYSGFLTYVGLLSAAFITYLLFAQLLIAGFRRGIAFEVLGLCVLILLPWSLLRAFSEWHANFGLIALSAYQPFAVALAASVLGTILLALGGGPRRARWAALLTIAALAQTALAAALLAPGGFNDVARKVASMSKVHLVGVACAAVVGAGSLLFKARQVSWSRKGYPPGATGLTRTQPRQSASPDASWRGHPL